MNYFRCAGDAKMKQKLISASNRNALKKKLKGIHSALECQDMTDVEHLKILIEVSKNDFVDDTVNQDQQDVKDVKDVIGN